MQTQDKKERVYQWLRGYIDEYKFSSQRKIPSENQLSRRFNVSRVTVRTVLKRLIDEGMIYAEKGSGTYITEEVALLPEKEAKSGRYKIGLILQGQDKAANKALLRGIELGQEEKLVDLRLFYTDNKFVNERRCLQSILACGYDGLIVDGVKASLLNPNLDCYQKFYHNQFPVIFYNNYYADLRYPRVSVDDGSSSAFLVDALLNAGHKNFVGIFVADNLKSIEKFRGMVERMKRRGLEFTDNDVKWCISDEAHDPSFAKSIERFLRSRPRATAILCCNYLLYTLVRQALAIRHKRIPEDYSVACFDYSEDNWQEEGVTCSLDQGEVIGALAVRKLIQMIQKRDFVQRNYSQLVEPRLYLGSSVAAPQRGSHATTVNHD